MVVSRLPGIKRVPPLLAGSGWPGLVMGRWWGQQCRTGGCGGLGSRGCAGRESDCRQVGSDGSDSEFRDGERDNYLLSVHRGFLVQSC